MRRRKRERKEGEEEVKERERGREGRRERGGRVGGERKGRQVTEPDGSGVIWFNPETKKKQISLHHEVTVNPFPSNVYSSMAYK